MKAVLRISALCLAGLVPLLAQAQALPPTPTVVGVDFRVVIPGSIQLAVNDHLEFTARTAVQDIVVNTTRRGTCLEVKNRTSDPVWRVDTDSMDWISKRSGQSYIFCTDRVGEQHLKLIQQFGAANQPWPITVTMGAKP